MKKITSLLLSFIILLGIYTTPRYVSAAENNTCNQYIGVKKIWWDGIELKYGQIGRLLVKQNTPLFKPEGEKRVFNRTLKAGESYRIYAYKPGMLSVGGGYFVARDSNISYQTPSKVKLQAVQCINGIKPEEPVKANFIDVGQGDSTLITLTNGKNILVDGGDIEAGSKVVTYLKEVGVKIIDLVISTNTDADHIGGLTDVLSTFPVKQVLDSGNQQNSQIYKDYLDLIDTKKIPLTTAKVGQSLNLDENVKITVLNSGETSTDDNQASIALKFTYGNMDVLLTSDADIKQEKEMLEKFNVEAEIFKASKHGSMTGNSLEFLKEVNPKTTVLSYGLQNNDGLPHMPIVNRLIKLGSRVFTTAGYTGKNTNVVFTINKGSYTVSGGYPLSHLVSIPERPMLRIESVDVENGIVVLKNTGWPGSLSGWLLYSVDENRVYTVSKTGLIIKSGPNVELYDIFGNKVDENKVN